MTAILKAPNGKLSKPSEPYECPPGQKRFEKVHNRSRLADANASKKSGDWAGDDDFRSESENPDATDAFHAEVTPTANHAACRENCRGSVPPAAAEGFVLRGCVMVAAGAIH